MTSRQPRSASRLLSGLFLLAVIGVCATLGVAAARLGTVALASFLVALGVVALATVRRARRLVRARELQRGQGRPLAPGGRSCTCCSSSVHDPVRVI